VYQNGVKPSALTAMIALQIGVPLALSILLAVLLLLWDIEKYQTGTTADATTGKTNGVTADTTTDTIGNEVKNGKV
jgi:hypothetical protein